VTDYSITVTTCANYVVKAFVLKIIQNQMIFFFCMWRKRLNRNLKRPREMDSSLNLTIQISFWRKSHFLVSNQNDTLVLILRVRPAVEKEEDRVWHSNKDNLVQGEILGNNKLQATNYIASGPCIRAINVL